MNVFKIIYYAFLIGVFFVALLLVVSIFPITGNFKVLVVQSGSMEPTIHTGAVVVVKPSSTYSVNDIITYSRGRSTDLSVTHRIVEVKTGSTGTNYVTRGDANSSEDMQEVRESEIIGKVSFNIPYIGYAVAAAKKPIGFTLIIIFPAAIIIYDEIRKIWEEAKKLKQNKKVENKA